MIHLRAMSPNQYFKVVLFADNSKAITSQLDNHEQSFSIELDV